MYIDSGWLRDGEAGIFPKWRVSGEISWLLGYWEQKEGSIDLSCFYMKCSQTALD